MKYTPENIPLRKSARSGSSLKFITVRKDGVLISKRARTLFSIGASFIEEKGNWFIKADDAAFRIGCYGSHRIASRNLGEFLMNKMKLKNATRFILLEAKTKGKFKLKKDGTNKS